MICSSHKARPVSKVKKQYLILAIIFVGAVALSLWTASRVDMHDVEQGLTNTSEEEHEGIIEGGNVPLYVAIVVILFVIALTVLMYWSRHR